MSEQPVKLYEFGRFRLDPIERLLHRDDEVVPLTPKVFDILLTLVENRGRVVEKDEMMRRVWPDSFVEDGNLTQNVSLLRKALGEGSNGTQYVETVARRGYRFVAEVRQVNGGHATTPTAASLEVIPPTLIAPTTSPYRPRNSRVGLFLGIGLLVVAVFVVIYLSGRGETADAVEGGIDSIAVLPFINDSNDPEIDHRTDRITESLINRVSQLPKLRVVPRHTAFDYKGKQIDPVTTGRNLNVRALLTGRVERRGDMFSLQADLVDVKSESQIWGKRYDRKFADLLLFLEDISRDIFENLRLKLSIEEKKRLDALGLYNTGRNYWDKRTPDGLKQAIDYFRRAEERDPNYAESYAGLADCYNMLVVYGVLRPKEGFPLAKEAARKALEIDNTLAEAHTSLAFIMFRFEWDRFEAEQEFKLAIKNNPGYAPAHQWYSSYLAVYERFDEAISQAKLSQQSPQPPSFITDSHLAWILYLAGRYDEAVEQCEKLLRYDQNFFPALRYLGLAYEQKGMPERAIAQFEKAAKLSGSPLMFALVGHGNAIAGKRDEARRVLNELEQLESQKYVSPYTVASIHAGLGERDQAFKLLEKAYQERDIWLMNLKVDPAMKPLRSDKRFADLLRRVGLTP